MAVLKGILSIYRTGEKKPIERYKAIIQIKEEHHSISVFKRILIDFFGLNDQAKKLTITALLKSFKISGKTENYSISTLARSGITPVAYLRW